MKLALTILLATPALCVDVELASPFTDHMVLQQGRAVPVWGSADPGEEVVVAFGERTARTRADAAGAWRVDLDPLRASAEPRALLVNGAPRCSDVLVGEVWIASGQSNMAWRLKSTSHAAEDAAAATQTAIRIFAAPQVSQPAPAARVAASWQVLTPENAPESSAVAQLFARRLHDTLGVPIGILNISWGGSACEAWTPREALAPVPLFAPILEREANGRPQHKAAHLWNGMAAPLVPYAIRGAIWYQGEFNVPRAAQYAELFPTMIAAWRAAWRQGDFPFYYVQIAPYRYSPRADPRAAAELREAQRLTERRLPHVGMACIADIGDVRDIHPRNKRGVAERLAALALARTYGLPGVDSGPAFAFAERAGKFMSVAFTSAEGLATRDGQAPGPFEVAGADGRWTRAHAHLDGRRVVVWGESVPQPTQVRYAWREDWEGNLVNRAGLPTSSFTSSEEAWVTADER